jgi:hypothetical protein
MKTSTPILLMTFDSTDDVGYSRRSSTVSRQKSLTLELGDLLGQLWAHLEEVSLQSVVGNLENGLVGIYIWKHVLVLTATMTFESFMPARCCTAPEIPKARYS